MTRAKKQTSHHQQTRKTRLSQKQEPDLNSELEIQRHQPARRIETSDEAEFGDTQPSSQGNEVELNASRAPSADDIDPAVVQAERHRRIDRAQDEELRLPERRAESTFETPVKWPDDFVLSEDGLLYRHNRSLRRGGDDEPSLNLRLVVPTTMVDEVLQNCHNSVEGGHQGIVRTYHRVKSDYYWIGLYADVVRHVQSCEDCCTSKSKPHLRGYSPGNIVSDRPFHIVSMDFVIPLPRTRRGNTALLPFRDHFTGFVIAKTMAETGALEVAKVFEGNVFQKFGAPSLVRHDGDPSRDQGHAELQANGQQERSVKTMIQTVRVYVEDPLQADWDDIAEKMVYAINNSRDSTRDPILPGAWLGRTINNEGYDGSGKGKIARLIWSLQQANRKREVALRLAAEYQLKEKARRAKEHNESLSRVERRATAQARDNSETAELGGASAESVEATAESMGTPAEPTKPLFKEGDQAWLFMERVKQGLTKKLAHRWHGPFRVKRKVEEFAYELELPDKSGYRFYPVIHVSRLKKGVDTKKRPTTRVIAELEEDQRFDFDEELLPEDSWEPDEGASQYEVEAILDDELPLSTSTARNERRFKVKWVGYEEPSWETLSNLSCGGLLFDY
ncbi:LOW QUALITY PROTEIN: Hypothetical protein PHPALM_19882 [Phytophthora palmivora]|uniref:Chromo domain-containing protein n=1 Tax=Phytophthora palmivora TaxID=4796 RepID=A0A2P4XG89_9STRA|nr:LOW QUALITY PROTEIN: Hypothetical protein PHPALM_19882 [Phytophthora palmivora]